MSELSNSSIEQELKELIVSSLGLEDIEADEIETDMPLFGEGLALDSIDALELGLAISKKYGIELSADNDEIKAQFRSVRTLSELVVKSQSS